MPGPTVERRWELHHEEVPHEKSQTTGGLLTGALGRGSMLMGAEELGDPRGAGGGVDVDQGLSQLGPPAATAVVGFDNKVGVELCSN